MQTLANNWCLGTAGSNNPTAPGPVTSACHADITLRGNNTKGNKYPGSILTFDYPVTTTYRFADATYLTETQSALYGFVVRMIRQPRYIYIYIYTGCALSSRI